MADDKQLGASAVRGPRDWFTGGPPWIVALGTVVGVAVAAGLIGHSTKDPSSSTVSSIVPGPTTTVTQTVTVSPGGASPAGAGGAGASGGFSLAYSNVGVTFNRPAGCGPRQLILAGPKFVQGNAGNGDVGAVVCGPGPEIDFDAVGDATLSSTGISSGASAQACVTALNTQATTHIVLHLPATFCASQTSDNDTANGKLIARITVSSHDAGYNLAADLTAWTAK